MKHTITINSLAALPEAAKEFLKVLGDHRLIALHGSMGAGKTTFTTALCRELGVRCLMEWAENIEDLLPEETLVVHISVGADGSRTLSWED